ncbi:MAG: hypothetical protein NZ927_06600 [Candidatus Calescibacterium sp.]|nr:hypothetical protein [Candidatus Calescibacterium sp.]MCX7734053.1 hypothetical protein [bacterium]MDW8087048.1 hypothetical protein [Candidatus Calescibacterium sp.]
MIKFGTDGWRARIGQEFTFDNVGLVNLAYSRYIKKNFKNPEVVVGYDTRFLSDEFAKFSASVLAHEDIKVFLSEKFCPTPAVSFFIGSQKLSGGIAITASHNPYQFNGYKVREWFGGPASPETTSEIERIIQEIKPEWDEKKSKFKYEESGGYKTEDIVSPYVEAVVRDSEVRGVLKKIDTFVFDLMHGACIGLPSMIFGKKAVEIRNTLNPLFPDYGKPEPTPYTLLPLQQTCKKLRKDGFAFDGDGDRIYACTKTGKIIDAHRVFAMLIEYISKYRNVKGKVYKTVTASDLVEKVANFYGFEVVTTPVGFKHLIKGMIEDNAVIAGEESGGIGISYHLKERDSLFCSCLVIKYSFEEGKDFSSLISRIEKKFGKHIYLRQDFHISDEKKQEVMDKAGNLENIDKFKVETIETIDGYKIRFKGGGFLLVRPSGTEPVLRVYAETDSEQKTKKIISSFCKIFGIENRE